MYAHSVTLIGFAALLLNYITVCVYLPQLEGSAPSWVYLAAAIGIRTCASLASLRLTTPPHGALLQGARSLSHRHLSLLPRVEWYSLLDNLDGRQARRTQTSSPLGELFDHGIVSSSTVSINPSIQVSVSHSVPMARQERNNSAEQRDISARQIFLCRLTYLGFWGSLCVWCRLLRKRMRLLGSSGTWQRS